MLISSPPSRANLQFRRGFSLVEIAVVLVIIAILATAIGVPLASQLDQQRTLDTQKQLEVAREAIYGFAMANGRLPCPATDGVIYGGASSSGAESFAGGGTPSNGNCLVYTGFVPLVTLGLTGNDGAGFMADSWNAGIQTSNGVNMSRIRYAVRGLDIAANTPPACPLTITKPLTRTNGIKDATMGCLSDSNAAVNLLTVVTTTVNNVPAGCTPSNLTTKAPFVIFSLGKNAATTGGTGADEAPNVVTTATTFVSHTPTPSANCAGEFDDIVTWGSLNTLFSRMVQAGKLP